MNIDREIEPSRPAPDRDAGRDRDPARHGHRRESDAKHPRRDFSDRVDGVVRDVAAFRVVALADLITHQFDGHPFAGRRGIGEAEQRGWIERQTAHGPKGGRFTVVVATPAGPARAAGLWATEGRASQRVFSGAVKTADMRHDVAVYRAACEAHARIDPPHGGASSYERAALILNPLNPPIETGLTASGACSSAFRRAGSSDAGDGPLANIASCQGPAPKAVIRAAARTFETPKSCSASSLV